MDEVDLRALMFQSGYLTIAEQKVERGSLVFELAFPNEEVSRSFNTDLLRYLGKNRVDTELRKSGDDILSCLATGDFPGFERELKSLLAAIPHHWYDNSYMGRYEAHYASMLLVTFRSIGADVRAEDSSAKGRADLVLLLSNQVYVMELKVSRS